MSVSFHRDVGFLSLLGAAAGYSLSVSAGQLRSIGLLATAIYCADSRATNLMLLDGLTGQESDGHDWYNLLNGWGLLELDTQIARWMRMIAWLICVGSIVIAV